jgi:DNA-binding transcriptional regulator YiaG
MLIMSVASVDSGGPRNVEMGLPSLEQQKAATLLESDEHKVLGDLTRFVENSDLSIPRIAALMGVSDAVLSMWIARTIKPTPIKLLEIRTFLEKFGYGPPR